MRLLIAIGRERRLVGAAGSVLPDAPEGSVRVRCEQDHAVGVPRAAAAIWRRSQHGRGTASTIDALQLIENEESQGTPVGRPERIRGSLRTCNRPRVDRVERADPEL